MNDASHERLTPTSAADETTVDSPVADPKDAAPATAGGAVLDWSLAAIAVLMAAWVLHAESTRPAVVPLQWTCSDAPPAGPAAPRLAIGKEPTLTWQGRTYASVAELASAEPWWPQEVTVVVAPGAPMEAVWHVAQFVAERGARAVHVVPGASPGAPEGP